MKCFHYKIQSIEKLLFSKEFQKDQQDLNIPNWHTIHISAKMYSVHVTPGRSTEQKKNSADMDNEIRTYGRQRKESISVKLVNYIRSQFQSDAMSGESEKV